ncbi:MAG: hypothetical protein FD138_3468 [Planctomycetota bacterium]|nr:MAG: hypothetical protein FD138_3468 [Planctomycetota bacterium]
METSTLPVGSGSLVDLIHSSASLATVAEPPNSAPATSVDFVVQTAGAEVACEPTAAAAPALKPKADRRRDSQRPTTSPNVARRPISRRTNSLMGVQIVGSGSYVPEHIVTNADRALRVRS